MTTGRINQVTILNPSAEAHEQTPEEAGCTKEGSREAAPAARAVERCTGTPTPRATDSIAPTEFPKVRSAPGHCSDVAISEQTQHMRPSGGEDSRFVITHQGTDT